MPRLVPCGTPSAIRMLVLAAGFLVAPFIASAQSAEAFRDKVLSDPRTTAAVKDAIRKHLVVLGMCPLEAFAAAGLPGPYHVTRDAKKWDRDVPPPRIVIAQCESPDESVVELMFQNQSQFGSAEPVAFRVRFVHGRAVLIDRKAFSQD